MMRLTFSDGEKMAQLDLIEFCRGMISAASAWFECNKDNENVKANLPTVICPRNIKYPFFDSTLPVIA
jgi:hypothetical protein